MYRQGDISLKALDKLPDNCHISLNGNVLAHGEASGHRHWIDEPDTVVYEDLNGNVYVELKKETVLVHTGPDLIPPKSVQEAKDKDLHMPLELKRGVYQLAIESDYDPYAKITLPVID